jgi:hypothetical protein
MEAIYYIVGVLMMITLIGLVVALIVFLIKPNLLQRSKHVNRPIPRLAILGAGIATFFVVFIGYGSVLAATEPASVKQERIAREAAETKTRQDAERKTKEAAEAERIREEEARKPIVKTETKTEIVNFESIEQQDNTLGKGQSRVAAEGVAGERTITYEVTYTQGKETTRKETKNEITKAPVAMVTQIGTYVAPPPPPVVPTPAPQIQSNVRTGAICNDGSPSNATGRGACSHHGGVAYWLYG